MFLSALSPQALAAVWGVMATDIRFLRQAMATLGVKAAMLQLIRWRVTLYVSTKDDGTIDPATDAIGSSTLAKVGTIVYNNIFAIDSNAYVFIQTTEHAETRSANWMNLFAYTSPVKVTDDEIPGSDYSLVGGGDKIYHKTSGPAELPMYGAYNNAPSAIRDIHSASYRRFE